MKNLFIAAGTFCLESELRFVFHHVSEKDFIEKLNSQKTLALAYLSSDSQKDIKHARSKCRLVREIFSTLTAHRATFASNFISSYRKWNAATKKPEQCQ
jgi:hypothetical protein